LVAAALFTACSSDAKPAATSSATSAATSTTAATGVGSATTGLDADSETTTSVPTSTAAGDSGETSFTGPVDPGMTVSSDGIPSSIPMDTEVATTNEGSATSTTDAPTTTTEPAPAIAPYTSEIYSDPAHWICRGDMDDVCDKQYPLTKVAADGTATSVPYFVADDAPIDCFYVYPTSSADPTFNSDLSPDAEIGVTTYQAARFNQVCKMYVPVYRSVTLAGLFGRADGTFATGWALAYDDVLDAWKSYLANDNHGRPVVIISHSQGSFHVTRLLREEIDPNPAERALVVSAILPGTSFQVATGKDVGGDTQNMPLCRSNDQFGCIVTFQSYRDSVPPLPGALFGSPGADTDSSCTNPAALAGGPGLLDNSFANGEWVLSDPDARANVTTALVDLPGLVTAECKVTAEGYSYLSITVNADPADPRADDIPGDGSPNWGLHTIDLNVTQETLIQLVREQSAAYLAANG
jgi:Protein of unknown function (DUF3089)